ncbi:hypothetical protein DPMN_147702 [Dreissena polymorpha]|uniref:Uncharacterized protein n=1 Tax=Dreissena polymorpha TaxID=45954 RepID=A0A9D4FCN8_DREPO|nr:hypothetical protein DPMN_147702 [Dreissena polymorpha]
MTITELAPNAIPPKGVGRDDDAIAASKFLCVLYSSCQSHPPNIDTYKDFQPDDPLDTGAWKLEENSLKPVWMRKPKLVPLQHYVSAIDLTKDACLNAHRKRMAVKTLDNYCKR